ncbi:pyruvyl transferase EpsO [Bisgaardia hudsonensis]|uniref:Pyruvyl transferase EpsO n=1 Tax=Bisgaardia hudsonensis TaxID=109472 RepID=A0A4R2N119_9PAST|nr:polysaccharide pyruvyl transferase family protein [Bisgaardia hudsonensis]QLB13180.1 polysaccharide pyruvyl transferase [Bisgaardia hudsonensis]TCP13245.1 pyruvyl transferase EpsO [Bisgaardia hudsonensis]
MNQVLVSLKKQLQQIAEIIVDRNDVMYFDYPLHLNVGDLLIYVGTETFWKDYGINIRLRRCWQNFDVKEITKYITPNTTLVCHGGGNFGDIYEEEQRLRETLIKSFPNNRIIVLPQTAYFSDEKALEKSASIFLQHNDCHLFARDLNSLTIMQAFSNKVTLSPDMAHQLYGMLHRQSKSAVENKQMSEKNTLYFLRKDIEASHIEKNIQVKLSANAHIKDWEDLLIVADDKVARLCSKLSKIANILHLSFLKNWVSKIWYHRALSIIKRVNIEFLRYDFVVTSRLHGHIFSCLLELPHAVCDNSYGKNLAYYEQWTKEITFAKKYE